MTCRITLSKILLPIVTILLILAGVEGWIVNSWASLQNPNISSIRKKFGEPVADIGSGIHIYVYHTFLSRVLEGSADSTHILYIRYFGFELLMAQSIVTGNISSNDNDQVEHDCLFITEFLPHTTNKDKCIRYFLG